MALLYGLLRVIAFALMKKATWKHRRAKTRLEKADKSFREIENSCKAEEVASGRQANFASQFKMMKQFEVRDTANGRWKLAAKKMKKRVKLANWLKNVTGKKVPYAIGLVDMALAFGVYQWVISDPTRIQLISELASKVW